MVNSEAFAKRLETIMNYYDFSATAFADKVQVGRSSISHILSGRNKPSLDFVLKVLQQFPAVEIHWLLNGKGNFPKQNASSPSELTSEKNLQKSIEKPLQSEKELLPLDGLSTNGRQIKKVLVLYDDGTFEAFEK